MSSISSFNQKGYPLDPSLNALHHGASALTLFIPGEDPQDFYALLDQSFATCQPTNPQESQLVYDSVHARWHLNRRLRVQAAYELHLHQTKPDITQWTPADLHQLELFDRYHTRAERAFRRAFVNVQSVRKSAAHEQHWREQLALQKERIAIDRQRFELAQSKEARRAAQKTAPLKENLSTHQSALAPIQHDATLNCSVIVQRSFISFTDDEISIDQISPPHHEVRQLIEQRDLFEHPPQLIVRYFTFLNDIPDEYELFFPAPVPRTSDARYFLRLPMDFEKYRALADREDIRLAAQPPLDELISDEDWLTQQRLKNK